MKFLNLFLQISVLAFASMVLAQSDDGTRSAQKYLVPPQVIRLWHSFDGKVIRRLEFKGLQRTNPKAARWFFRSQEETVFNADILARDVQQLYNTGIFYDVIPDLIEVPGEPGLLDLEVQVKDKWTLVPFGGAKAGGGSLTFGGGIYEGNLGGYLIQGFINVYSYNNTLSHDIRIYQDRLLGTDYLGRVRVANVVEPILIHHINNQTAGDYTWSRRVEEVHFGKLFDTDKMTFILSGFNDSLVESKGVNSFVYQGRQYSLEVKYNLGVINKSEYNEEGTQVVFSASAANFFGSENNYQKLGVQFKNVALYGKDELAVFLEGRTMSTLAPPPYQNEVGGYSSVRGYLDNRFMGPYMARNNLEYRKLIFTDRWSLLGLDLIALQAVGFSDIGSAWGDDTLTRDPGAKTFRPIWSVGGGFRLHFVKLAGVIMRLDGARTLSPDEGWGIALGVGQFF